ncbi:type I-E CRISPR-associated protein Cas5/CasD [Pseudomonas sp. B21-019]|uniref:type I-E CRISPR-associated protein Cas5/CasD n=1 Tax=Pseudomonas sp. B21-019 TaxID=2895475 RepID=UPI00215DE06C|nr:type I-E CRISPR-associated protein Cas5/CasD [Pseudomonas sp. B21-019]UVM35017.1 type I-E CRISPR-associated protein Cas5/CasD [Pseudomonas sp. B21-019]
MTNRYLLMWLEAPLQSWGYDSKFARRDSLDFPTKSGVLGLLCCAIGAGGPQEQWLAHWSNLDMQVDAYMRTDWQGNPLSRLPLLRDFQMVGSSYGDPPWEKLMVPKMSDGGSPNGSGVKVTHRYYVQDMAFAVALEVPAALEADLVEGLDSPVWPLYLGRKCCVPSELINQGVYVTASEAMRAGAAIAADKKRALSFSVVQAEAEGELLTLNDVPLAFGEHKHYQVRQVTVLKTS